MLQLSYPWMLLLLPLPLLIRYLAPAYREPRPAVRVPFMNVLRRLTGSRPGSRSPTNDRRTTNTPPLPFVYSFQIR